jgi:hypothetical protein
MRKFRSDTPASLSRKPAPILRRRNELQVNKMPEYGRRGGFQVPQWTSKWVRGLSTRLGESTISCTQPEAVEI